MFCNREISRIKCEIITNAPSLSLGCTRDISPKGGEGNTLDSPKIGQTIGHIKSSLSLLPNLDRRGKIVATKLRIGALQMTTKGSAGFVVICRFVLFVVYAG